MQQVSNFSLADLYRDRFGYVAAPFPILPPAESKPVADSKSFNSFKSTVAASTIRKTAAGWLESEIRMPVEMRIPGGDWFLLPYEPLVGLKGAIDETVTSLNRGRDAQGRNRRGTVKQQGSLEDYIITIKGFCLNEAEDDYPEAQVANLRKIIENGYAEIRTLVAGIFNISLVSIKNWDLPPPPEDMPISYQDYSLTLTSDENFELEIVNN